MEKFDFNTIKNFDDHIAKSVSNYNILFDLIQRISTYFITENSNVYDLGCSQGTILKKLAISTPLNASFTGYDISDNLLPKMCTKELSYYKRDVTEDSLKLYNTNLILSIFTLQFIEIEKRYKLIRKVYESLNKGGAFIVAEKIYLKDGHIQDIFTFSHYDQKLEHFTAEEILFKQRDLRIIMKPLTEDLNIRMFNECGFINIESFYQSLNFKAWILIK